MHKQQPLLQKLFVWSFVLLSASAFSGVVLPGGCEPGIADMIAATAAAPNPFRGVTPSHLLTSDGGTDAGDASTVDMASAVDMPPSDLATPDMTPAPSGVLQPSANGTCLRQPRRVWEDGAVSDSNALWWNKCDRYFCAPTGGVVSGLCTPLTGAEYFTDAGCTSILLYIEGSAAYPNLFVSPLDPLVVPKVRSREGRWYTLKKQTTVPAGKILYSRGLGSCARDSLIRTGNDYFEATLTTAPTRLIPLTSSTRWVAP